MKIKAINYLRPKTISCAKDAQAILNSKFKTKIGIKPKIKMDADLFGKEYKRFLLPENLHIRVIGKINEKIKIFGGKNALVKADTFNKGVELFGSTKLKANKIDKFLHMFESSKAHVKEINGSASLFDKSILNAGIQKGNLTAQGHASASVGGISGKVRAAGNSEVNAFSISSAADASGNAKINVMHLKGEISELSNGKVQIMKQPEFEAVDMIEKTL